MYPTAYQPWKPYLYVSNDGYIISAGLQTVQEYAVCIVVTDAIIKAMTNGNL